VSSHEPHNPSKDELTELWALADGLRFTIIDRDAEIEKLHSENSWKQMRIEIQGEAVVKLEAQLAAHREFVKAFDAFRVESFDDIDVDSYFEGWIDMGNIAKARKALEDK